LIKNHQGEKEMATDWSDDVLKSIQDIVDAEAQRIKIAEQFLPFAPNAISPGSINVVSDIISQDKDLTLIVDQGDTTSFYQLTVTFKLSDAQYSDPGGAKTAMTLATRAANLLSQAEDILIFQGASGESNPIFTGATRQVVIQQSGKPSPGLLQLPAKTKDTDPIDPSQIIKVLTTSEPSPLVPSQNRYGENTFAAVADGYSRLQAKGDYGPYALVLNDLIFADIHAPLAATLIMPADRIKPFVTLKGMNNTVKEMLYGTGTMPLLGGAEGNPTGLLVSIGGNTVDLVIKTPPTVSQLPYQPGFYPFQVTTQFAVRIKKKSAFIRFVFERGKA
jgi:hypothetical protein